MSGLRAAVASGHPLSSAAAVEILRAGGNAFDAVVAALAASFSTEPVLCSPGGGGFLLAHPVGSAPRVLDFFCQTPGRSAAGAREPLDFQPLQVDFGPATQEFHVGRAAAAVPGMIPGLCGIASELGCLPLGQSLQPGIRLARKGVRISAMQAHIMQVVRPILCHTPAAREHFGAAEGSLMRCAALADTLSALAEQGEQLFRRGAVAEAICELCAPGGLLQPADLEAYQIHWREPLSCEAMGARILSTPAPSAGGALVLFGLQLAQSLSEYDPTLKHCVDRSLREKPGARSPTATELAQIMALTVKARDRAGLHDNVEVSAVNRLLDPQSMKKAANALAGLSDPLRARKRGGTTHVSVIDGAGNVAACTVSNGEGCGHMVPGAGFMLNNMLGEEDLNPSGFFRWQPDTRITSMMAPTLAECADGRLLALGSGGSNRIRSALLQVLCHSLAGSLSLEEAVNAARLHVEGDFLHIEGGFEPDTVLELQRQWPAHQCWPGSSMFFGGVHAVARSADGILQAAADLRRGGSAVVLDAERGKR